MTALSPTQVEALYGIANDRNAVGGEFPNRAGKWVTLRWPTVRALENRGLIRVWKVRDSWLEAVIGRYAPIHHPACFQAELTDEGRAALQAIELAAWAADR